MRSPDSYKPTRVLFWFEIGFCQLIALVWIIAGFALWNMGKPPERSIFQVLIAGLLYGNGAYFISKGVGALDRLRYAAPNPLLWPVLYTAGAAFLSLACFIAIFASPPLTFLVGFSILIFATPFICAHLAVITLHYFLGYDVKILTQQIQTLINSSHGP